MSDIKYIDDVELEGKTILLRADFNVSLNPNYLSIADDERIRQVIPTIKYLLKRKNKLILASHLGRPKGERVQKFSLQIVCNQIKEYLPDYDIRLIQDFLTEPEETFKNQKENEIFVYENTRFYPGEKKNDPEFAKKMASHADVFVNDAFGVSHREDASVVGVTNYLPSYGGLLLKKEIQMLSMILKKPEKPFVAAIGGAKIETKIKVLDRMMELADHLIIAGALANTFLYAQGIEVGASLVEKDKAELAQKLLFKAAQNDTSVILPSDCVVGNSQELEYGGRVCKISEVPKDKQILDIGPETTARIGTIIAKAKTIVWNGPVGYFENIHYRQGTDFMYYAITNNEDAVSIVGGGDTLAAISKKEYLEKLTHISTGGGAMLEFIEKGTLPGIEALKK
ncbi:phosphoglycerate kinase [Candidatus Roizmanbacteria bacterium CG_4_9_14_0_2_um_filter_39_13]|uniref:Phosphoglycerate kinase n=2 Tax=Candidatus Roizmaniibacteriota TaxID=1752723 RepID=A0A2M8F1G4_9BACT|nr:MAG: phosphoglycerate kinase [Candidatus Roizmanbacteria bacterium CG_4_10_14_0_2_um_filter_39_12]PJC33090.1 MAG: phosphoglycerate kinase [Candidatus Roizmanbacteria bacterium CG_4_9_14_0_2_um_filter_39_13]PJE61999.1 MAG: phosphoglycerate kinase [Candidatus Roizmanbacteria bacterium CG10_big_fil_rev_8_21_14_0_10_39_12]